MIPEKGSFKMSDLHLFELKPSVYAFSVGLTENYQNYVSYFVEFSGFIGSHSYFLTIILITMSNQHSYNNFIRTTNLILSMVL